MQGLSGSLPLVPSSPGRGTLAAPFLAFAFCLLLMRLFLWSNVSLKYLEDFLFLEGLPAAAVATLNGNEAAVGSV